ncbi:MAG: hydrogenase small subunit [Haloferacaceae archaeon]
MSATDDLPEEVDELADEPDEGAGRNTSGGDDVEMDVLDVFWLAGEGCDGCSISVLGATNPGVEDLLTGSVPHLPRLNLHHPVLAFEWGDDYLEALHEAARGERDPYAVVVEGSVPNERLIEGDGAEDGYWIAVGEDEEGNEMRMVDWLDELAPGAAVTIAIGTCATWGGVPAAQGNVTDAMGTMDYLGRDYRSALGLPVVNVPGCAPVGDNFIETVAHLLLYAQDMGPLPELDELGRPKWLFGETVHRNCERGSYYEEGVFAEEYGSEKCLVELGCWGPVVKCNMVSRRNLDGVGGCMNVGGKCIGCTMPGFPDKFTPFFKTPPGTLVSSTGSRILGSVVRRLRNITIENQDREVRWDESMGLEERAYQWLLKRGSNYDRDRGTERTTGRGD